MLTANLVIAACLIYVAILFAVAFAGDRRARRDPTGWLTSPLVYTLSISIYCTSWTFFGAVGSAARSGLEFATIYLGPTIVFVGWWIFLRKLVTIGRLHHSTSIADFISARFGKHSALGALVTIVALVATAPYIALQLKALTASYQVITSQAGAVKAAAGSIEPDYVTAFWLAAGLCVFAIIFGVRKIDVNERHHGVIAAIAVEAVVKLVALARRRPVGRARARRPFLGGLHQRAGQPDCIRRIRSARAGSRCSSLPAPPWSACRASFRSRSSRTPASARSGPHHGCSRSTSC